MFRHLALGCAALGLAGCGARDVVRPPVSISGTLIYLERIAVPPGAVLDIELREIGGPRGPVHTLASERRAAEQGPPFQFSFEVPREEIDPQGSLTLFAAIREGDRLVFVTDPPRPVPHEGTGGLEVRLSFVPIAVTDPAPAPTSYRCGEEVFRVAFEEERASVTLPDDSAVTLERLPANADPQESRTYTDGQLTFFQTTENGEARVAFARGRMAPVPCEAVP